MSPDPDFAWLEQIIMAARADGEVVQVGGVAVVVRRRAVAVGDLTGAEAAAIEAAELEGPGYELDDLDEDGRWRPGRRPAWWPGSS